MTPTQSVGLTDSIRRSSRVRRMPIRFSPEISGQMLDDHSSTDSDDDTNDDGVHASDTESSGYESSFIDDDESEYSSDTEDDRASHNHGITIVLDELTRT